MPQLFQNNKKFDQIFIIATTAMRVNRSHPYIPRNRSWRIQFGLILFSTFCCLCCLLYSLLLHDIRNGKFTEASKNAIMSIVGITITYKYSILLRYHEPIMDLIRIVDEDYELAKQLPEDEQRVVSQYSERGVKVCRFWFYSACGTSAIFPLKACLLMGKSYFAGEFELVPMFDLKYPLVDEYKSVPILFGVLFALALFFDIYATSMYIGFDPLVPIFMLHLCGQLDILNLRISKLFSNNDPHELVRTKLNEIIRKLQEINRIIGVIKANFTVLYEFNMKTTTFLMPLTAFQVTESLRHGEVNFEFIGFFTGVILHFYMPCYYSDLLMETGEKFRLAIYSCGWETHSDRRVLRSILFMLTRATRPLVISTVFYAICLDTFAQCIILFQLCRDAYSIFNLMNAAWA